MELPMPQLLARLAIGGLAGCLATIPMTLWMAERHRRLARAERGPLPPHPITMKVAKQITNTCELSPDVRNAITIVGHFGYGATMGATYAALVPIQGATASIISGTAFGGGV